MGKSELSLGLRILRFCSPRFQWHPSPFLLVTDVNMHCTCKIRKARRSNMKTEVLEKNIDMAAVHCSPEFWWRTVAPDHLSKGWTEIQFIQIFVFPLSLNPIFSSFFDYQSTHRKQKTQKKIKSFPILMINNLRLILVRLSSKSLVIYIEIPRILTCIWFLLFYVVMEIWTQNIWKLTYDMDQRKIRWHLWKLKYSQSWALC